MSNLEIFGVGAFAAPFRLAPCVSGNGRQRGRLSLAIDNDRSPVADIHPCLHSHCPERSTSRLVASNVVCGHRRKRVSASSAAESITCSQLSRTSKTFLLPMARATEAGEIFSPPNRRPSTPATFDGTNCGSESETSSDKKNVTLYLWEEPSGHFGCQHGFPDPAKSGECHRAVGRDKVAQMLHRCLPPNERASRSSNICQKRSWRPLARSIRSRLACVRSLLKRPIT